MAQYPKTYDGSLQLFIRKMEAEHLAPRTVSFYVETVHAVTEILRAGGRHTLPREITRADVDYLLDYFVAHDFAIQTRKGYLSALKRWCGSADGSVVHDWPRYRFPHDNRPHADWLDSFQAANLLSHPKTPIQAVVIHLELCLGMRHVEVIRLKTADIDYDRKLLTIIGKGSIGWEAQGRSVREGYGRSAPRLRDRQRRTDSPRQGTLSHQYDRTAELHHLEPWRPFARLLRGRLRSRQDSHAAAVG